MKELFKIKQTLKEFKMKKILLMVSILLGATAAHAIAIYGPSSVTSSDNTLVGQAASLRCGMNTQCSIFGNQAVLGTLAQTTATTQTLTRLNCGQTIKNSGAVVATLPEASALLGCRITFITANASNFDVNPFDATDKIEGGLTNAAGDAIRNATLGNSITLEAISDNVWGVQAIQGTWTDVN